MSNRVAIQGYVADWLGVSGYSYSIYSAGTEDSVRPGTKNAVQFWHAPNISGERRISAGFKRQSHGQTGTAALGVGGAHAAVVRHDDLLDQGEPKAGSAGFGREEWPENALQDGG